MGKTIQWSGLALLACVGPAALAAEYGTVVSSTPVVQQVAVPQQSCYDEQQTVQQRPSGAGALVGAVIGGAIGNTIGGGAGRAVATGAGVMAGAVLGNQAEANNLPPTTATVRRCQTATRYENRTVGYDVVYDYNGQRYTTRLAQDPGPRIALNVNVTPAAGEAAPAAPAGTLPPPVYVPQQQAPVTVVPQPPVVYYPAPSYYYGPPAVAVVPRVVIGGHWHHGRWYY